MTQLIHRSQHPWLPSELISTIPLPMNLYAIVEAGGKQLQVQAGRFYNVHSLISCGPLRWARYRRLLLYRVLLVRPKQASVILGAPWVQNAIVKGRLLNTRRDDKATVYKMHRKKHTRRKVGFRQECVRFVVDTICWHGSSSFLSPIQTHPAALGSNGNRADRTPPATATATATSPSPQ